MDKLETVKDFLEHTAKIFAGSVHARKATEALSILNAALPVEEKGPRPVDLMPTHDDGACSHGIAVDGDCRECDNQEAADKAGLVAAMTEPASRPQEEGKAVVGPRCGNCGEWCQFCREGKEGADRG